MPLPPLFNAIPPFACPTVSPGGRVESSLTDVLIPNTAVQPHRLYGPLR